MYEVIEQIEMIHDDQLNLRYNGKNMLAYYSLISNKPFFWYVIVKKSQS